MGDELVSVIIPAYNAEEYISYCLDSIMSQTYEDIELIVVNDGSKDKTLSIIKEYCQRDTRIICVDIENQGVSNARNVGIEKAKGEFICFVDADDWVDCLYIESALKYIKKYNLDVVLGGTEKVYKNYNQCCTIGKKDGVLIYENNINEIKAKILGNACSKESPLKKIFTSGSVAKLFKRVVIDNIRFNDKLIIGEDTIFNLQVVDNIRRMGVVSDIWYYYRMNDFSATRKYNPNIIQQSEILIDMMTEMYYGDISMRPYLCARAIQQFQGMLMLSILNKESSLRLKEKKKMIKMMLEDERWSSLFSIDTTESLPISNLDYIVKKLCVNKNVFGIMIFLRLRTVLREMINTIKSRGNKSR